MTYFVGAEGPRSARLAIVAEKGAVDEVKWGRPMVGTTGSMIRRHVRRARTDYDAGSGYWPYLVGEKGLYSANVWLTNAVHNFSDPKANPSNADLIREQPRLFRELASLPNLNCILAVGGHAFTSLTNFKYYRIDPKTKKPTSTIQNRRGSRFVSTLGVKLVASLHPSFYVQDNWKYECVTQHDFNLAIEESKTKDLIFKPRTYYIRPSSLAEALSWMNEIIQHPHSEFLAFDIETFHGAQNAWYMSCISFSDDPARAFCIPIMYRNRRPFWNSLYDEGIVWRKIQEVLNQSDRRYVTQNGHAFDTWQLYKHHISCPWMANGFDTYQAHMLLAPDLPHDLGFLVSIYTDAQYYKDESGRAEEKVFGGVDDDTFWTYSCKDSALDLECALGIMNDLYDVGMLNDKSSPLQKRAI